MKEHLIEHFLNLLIVIIGSVFGYYLGRAGKFGENKFNLNLEKFKQYDILRNAWYDFFESISDPQFQNLWNSGHLPTIKNSQSAYKAVQRKFNKVGIFLTQDMEIIRRYLNALIMSWLTHPATNEPIRIDTPIALLTEEISRKLYLMEELIKYECRTEVIHNTIFKSFFEADIEELEIKKEARRWRESKMPIFNEMKEFIDNYKSPFLKEVGK